MTIPDAGSSGSHSITHWR